MLKKENGTWPTRGMLEENETQNIFLILGMIIQEAIFMTKTGKDKEKHNGNKLG